ncbi:MAG: hypothetical protein Q7Q71_15770 [Verrucomicrobiota bacterium JB023]|nr:hypothetical protein [Verrucomicrobiota bacterium JB023]
MFHLAFDTPLAYAWDEFLHSLFVSLDGAMRNHDKTSLFTFEAEIGKTYRIDYSEDAVTWTSSESLVTAGSSRVYWLDQGPPKTDCHPAECGTRFYRAVAID